MVTYPYGLRSIIHGQWFEIAKIFSIRADHVIIFAKAFLLLTLLLKNQIAIMKVGMFGDPNLDDGYAMKQR